MKFVFMFFGFFFFSIAAQACTAVSSATTISSAGSYCLTNHIFVSTPGANGITVTASNVSIDLNAFAIVGPGYGDGSGIKAVNVDGLRVFSGSIRSFRYGIEAVYSDGSYVGYVDASDNKMRGIMVIGSGAIVEYSRVKNIPGLSTYPASHSIGIEVYGPSCHVRFNSIENIMPYGPGEGVGVSVSDNPAGCNVYDNLIRFASKPSTGRTFGVWVGGGAYPASIHNNVTLGADYGLFGYLATGNASGNHIHQRCPVFWSASDFAADNDLDVMGGCTDPEAGY